MVDMIMNSASKRPWSAVSIIALFFLMTISGVLHINGSVPLSVEAVVFDNSNSGVQMIDTVSHTTFFGTYVETPGCKLGSLIWVGDVNGDGTDDLSYVRNDQYGDQMEILLGSEQWYNGTFGLSSVYPDLKLDYTSVKGIESGDVNGDGFNDLILGSYMGGYILWGPDFNSRNRTSVQIGSMAPTMNQRYGDFITVSDLDKDGISEVIGGLFGLEGSPSPNPPPDHVLIRWGDTGNTTTISPGTFIRYGCSVESGDIDGDGCDDLVIGSSNYGQEGINRMGAVYIYFNASRLKENRTWNSDDAADVIITGTDAYDQFGWRVKLHDLNEDGRMDIIAGSPGADGPGNDRINCGEIMVFRGRDNSSFPKMMNAENSANIVVVGGKGSDTSKPSYPGDRLGEVFEMPDMDGDGTAEVVIPYFRRNLDPVEGIPRSSAGALSVYSLHDFFPVKGGISLISYPSGEFNIEGIDIEDSLGWQIDCGDLNGDQMEDLVITAPGADGPGNEVLRAGEIYVVLGSGLSLRETSVHGEGAAPPMIFAGGGWVNFDLSYIDTFGADEVVNGTLIMDPADEGISISCKSGEFTINNDRFNTIELDEKESGFITDGSRGIFRIRMKLDPFFPGEGEIDLRYEMDDRLGIEAVRDYVGSISISKDMEFRGDLNITVNGRRSPSLARWVRPEDLIGFSGPRVVYSDQPERMVRSGFPNIELARDDDETIVTENSEEWELSSEAPFGDSVDYRISLVVPEERIPSGLDKAYIPGTGKHLTRKIGIDVKPPDPVTNLSINNSGDINDNGLFKRSFNISWDGGIGGRFDAWESGIKEYTVEVEGSGSTPASSAGGLFGTYYDGSDFTSVVMERIDPLIEFNRSDWGYFGPDPALMRPHSFSVRWHGWFVPETTEDYTFMVEGSGEASVILDGKIIFESVDIAGGSASESVFLSSYERYSIEIYYRNDGPLSWFRFRSKFSYYPFEIISTEQFYHPSLSKIIYTDLAEGLVNVSVSAVDWVDRGSGTLKISDMIDMTPPEIELTDYHEWVNTTTPTISISTFDPELFGFKGSGIDPLSATYSLKRPDGRWEIPTDRGRKIMENNTFDFKLDLPGSYMGEIRFECSDLDGNVRRTEGRFLGVDVDPPELNLISPDIFNYLYGLDQEFIVGIKTGLRSGLDENSGMYRFRSEGFNWSEWNNLNISTTGSSPMIQETILLPSGYVDIQFMAADIAGNSGLSDIFPLFLIGPDNNELPVPHISSPLNNSRIRNGSVLVLNAQGTYDDGYGAYPSIRLTWYSDLEGYLGSGNTIEVVPGKGTHRITLYADDGSPGHNISIHVIVQVMDPVIGGDEEDSEMDEGSGDLPIAALIVAISVILMTAAVVLYFLHTRSQGIDTALGMRHRTEDDDSYDESMKRKHRDLGYDIETGSRKH